MNKVIFLSGAQVPVTDNMDDYIDMFSAKAIEIQGQCLVNKEPVPRIVYSINQAWNQSIQDKPWETKMKSVITMFLLCDELHLLPSWQSSREAVTLRDLALKLNIPIIHH